MSLPPRQLLGLHLRSRQSGPAAVTLAGIAAVLAASHHWTKDAGLFPQLLLLLITAATATTIATGTRNPFGEVEDTASSPLPVLRLVHLLAITGAAAVVIALAGLAAMYSTTGVTLLRNLAGFTGIALLTAALVGAHLAWTGPLGYVLYCGGQLDLRVSNLWTWPTLPPGDRAATTISLALLAAGVATVSLAGARDRRSERS